MSENGPAIFALSTLIIGLIGWIYTINWCRKDKDQ